MGDLRGYFDNIPDGRWGPSPWARVDRPANGHIRTAPSPRPSRPRRPDLPAARNPDGSLKVQPRGARSPAERRAIAEALDFIRGFEAR